MVNIPKLLEDDKPVWVFERSDRKGPEFDKDRPWLVLSTTYIHRLGIFFAPPFNTARDRTQFGLCVSAVPNKKSAGVIDVQQLWTFPVERIKHSDTERKQVSMSPDAPKLARDRLKEYLAFATGPRVGWLCQGRVVWLRLIPKWKDSHSAITTDIGGLLTISERLPNVAFDRPEDWTIPALVIANDAYLPSLSGDHISNIYAVTTVIPLILTTPELQTPERLQISQPGNGFLTLTPLTQCFLTLAYNEPALDGYEGIKFKHKEQETWCIDDEERRAIMDEVWSILGLKSGDYV